LVYGKGNPVRLAAHGFEDHVCIFVEDRGIGIDKESQARIFERFERAAPANSYRGMGLGLYIVRELVDAHGGKVRVESEPGFGARFIVELPRRVPVHSPH
jgi:signal transduction histidine kinase